NRPAVHILHFKRNFSRNEHFDSLQLSTVGSIVQAGLSGIGLRSRINALFQQKLADTVLTTLTSPDECLLELSLHFTWRLRERDKRCVGLWLVSIEEAFDQIESSECCRMPNVHSGATSD